jgi:hypothetical protein
MISISINDEQSALAIDDHIRINDQHQYQQLPSASTISINDQHQHQRSMISIDN